MRVLLDTHAFLWIVEDSPRSSPAALRLANDRAIEKVVSIVSLWEIAIKVRLKKLELAMEFDALVDLIENRAMATLLPITPAHVKRLQLLEMHHRDPFDRMLVAQALAENLSLVSGDASLDAYGVQRLW
jgi:PIN domain nuclease of toxin-antitoxin system